MGNSAAAVTVVHVLEALEGGTARHLVDLVGHTEGVRHEVALPLRRSAGVTDEAAAAALEDAGARLHRMDMRRSMTSPRNAAAVLALRRLAGRLRPHIVHGHSSVGGALARLACWDAPLARVYTPNGLSSGRVALAVERRLGGCTDRLVATSPSEGELARVLGLVSVDRLVVVPNGIEPGAPPAPSTDLRRQIGVPPGVPLVGTVARLIPQKAPLIFVRAAAQLARSLPDVHAVLVGSGPLRSAVRREVALLPSLAGRFHLVDVLPGAAAHLGCLDVFVLASVFEGGPYTPLEAMRAGVPVVLSDVVGNRDVVEHGVSGLVVPSGDAAAVATAVAGLLGDRERAGRLAEAGRRRVAERFDVATMGRTMAALYRELAGAPRRR